MEDVVYTGCVFHMNKIYELADSKHSYPSSLFVHPLLYLQNGYDTLITDNLDKVDAETVDPISAAKALLLLHTMPFKYGVDEVKSFFNTKKSSNVGYEIIPYGLLALMGGWLYRKYVYENKEYDIINKETGSNAKYKYPSADETFLVKHKAGYGFTILPATSSKEYAKIDDMLSDNIDIYIKNKLIELFKSFVSQTANLIDSLELRLKQYSENDNGGTTNSASRITYKQFIKILPYVIALNTKKDGFLKVIRTLGGKESVSDAINDGNTYYLEGFKNRYSCAFVNSNGCLITIYKEDDMQVQMLMDKLYNHKSGVLTLMCQNNPNTECKITHTSYKNALDGFSVAMKSLINRYSSDNELNPVKVISESQNDADEDLKKSIYLYFKQFWDKWYCSVYNRLNDDSAQPGYVKPFTTKWFEKQYLFVDTLYNDISGTFRLNCEDITEAYTNSRTDLSTIGQAVQTYLAKIANMHGCMFFVYPDFVNFAKYDSNGKKENPYLVLEDLFRPIPYSQKNDMTQDNQFVIMRSSNAQITGKTLQFKNDGFDIWTSSNETQVAPYTFKDKSKNYDAPEYETRLAYKVPSFGVAFSRQDNSIFKSIDVGMDTQQITSQSIKSLCYISQQGNKNKHAVTFYGNDIYGVYSSYSYIVTITMLGDMQIQPLMYFQLMNIPMFRGTYMIIEVSHSISAGDFTTTFRGMKMSKIEPPLTSTWFTISPEDSESNDSDSGDNCGNDVVDSDGEPVSDSDESSNNSSTFNVLYWNAPVSKIGVAAKGCEYNSNVCNQYFKDKWTNNAKATTLTNCEFFTVGTNFYTTSGGIVGAMYINGHKVGNTSTAMGGIVIYTDNTYKFCDNHTDWNSATEASGKTVKYAWQNYLCIINGKLNYVTDTKSNFRILAQTKDDKLVVFVNTNKCTFGEFLDKVSKSSLKCKNAIYFDARGATGTIGYGWGRLGSNKTATYKDYIRDGGYFWGPEDCLDSNVKTVFYIMK